VLKAKHGSCPPSSMNSWKVSSHVPAEIDSIINLGVRSEVSLFYVWFVKTPMNIAVVVLFAGHVTLPVLNITFPQLSRWWGKTDSSLLSCIGIGIIKTENKVHFGETSCLNVGFDATVDTKCVCPRFTTFDRSRHMIKRKPRPPRILRFGDISDCQAQKRR